MTEGGSSAGRRPGVTPPDGGSYLHEQRLRPPSPLREQCGVCECAERDCITTAQRVEATSFTASECQSEFSLNDT